jgi:HAD superfamily hydrolase (TIGR01509 family)
VVQSLPSRNSSFSHSIKAILFDLSGTLVDDLQAVYRGFVDLCKKNGQRIPKLDQFRKDYRLPYRDFIKEKKFTDIEAAVDYWKRQYLNHGDTIKLFDDVKPALENLKQKTSIKLGIVSQTPKELVVQHLKKFGIRDFFSEDGVVFDDKKPEPDGLKEALKKLNINHPNTVIYIGDMKEDCQAARAAGINPWAIYRERGSFHVLDTLKKGYPTRILKTLTELDAFVF